MTLPTKITFETDPRGGILQEWACQGYFTALRALDLEIVLPERNLFAPGNSDPDAGPQIVIACIDPVAERRSAWSGEIREGAYAICILHHGRIPESAIANGILSRFDEIWVASAPLAAALACRLAIPIIQLPTVVTTGGYVAGLRESRGIEEKFIIAASIDLPDLERSERPIAILEAFKRAFEPTDDVAMIIRADGGDYYRDGLDRLRGEIGSYPVTIDQGPRAAEDAMTLMASADLYLSLSRFDEMSLEIAHAMALRLPVVATGSPGNMEFMSPWNSFPVHVEPGTPEMATTGIPTIVSPWDPSIEHAGRLLRYVFENRDDGLARGERARHDISRWHSLPAASTEIARRLETVVGITQARKKRAQMPAATRSTTSTEPTELTSRMEELETRMRDLATREEELRQLLSDLRQQPLPAPGMPAAAATHEEPARWQQEKPVTAPSQIDRPQPAAPRPAAPQQKAPEPEVPAVSPTPVTPAVETADPPSIPQETAAVIREVRKAVLSVTPFNSVVIVVSGGENEYLQIEGRTAWHFPQQGDGRHSGLLPDSASRAINALEALRAKGAHYVVFPASAFWWLSLFANLEEHLERTGRRIWGDEQCIIYELADPAAATTPDTSAPDERKWGKLFKRTPPRA